MAGNALSLVAGGCQSQGFVGRFFRACRRLPEHCLLFSAVKFDGSARRSLHRATAIDHTMPNFAEILIRKRVISQDQLAEAKKLSKKSAKAWPRNSSGWAMPMAMKL